MFIFAVTEILMYSFVSSPLKVNPSNPRYFTDDSGKAIYLTGSHTWNNFKDMGKMDPPPSFDYEDYLNFLQRYNHNFIRLWTWELTKYSYDNEITYTAQFPWPRTGPGMALDGKPKFDLTKFEQSYFERLRSRLVMAQKRDIYVSIMLFEGHGLHASLEPWCWDGHPFNINNNINGINGDPNNDGRGIETHTLQIPAVTEIQETYIRKVIDEVNNLDNVLYEIVNESGDYSTEWQYYMIDYVHNYEKKKPKQHPVGMTFQYAGGNQRGRNETLFKSPADWISPSPDGGYRDDPPAADGSKVILNDTDHLWGIGGNQGWVWKSFCRGMNPLFMDPYRRVQNEKPSFTDHLTSKFPLDPQWESIRKNLGYTLSYAKRMDLVSTRPWDNLASTRYCLANPGSEYLVYLPEGGKVIVDLSGVSGKIKIEWFNPNTSETVSEESISKESSQEFISPFSGDAVLYIFKEVIK